MTDLYPLLFTPIYKTKIWGSDKFKTKLSKSDAPDNFCGESWEISGIETDCSIVANGHLEGNSLNELIDIYMDDLVGSKVIERFDHEFPLLIKFLDVNDMLSLQVHPNDEFAGKRHNSLGKSEMWYIVHAEEYSDIAIGFNRDIDRDTFIEFAVQNRLIELFNRPKVKTGDSFFLPAGLCHGGGKGLLIAEIQQSSDVTYRVYDWDRKDSEGKSRELHLDMALDVLDYSVGKDFYKKTENKNNCSQTIAACDYFVTNYINFDSGIIKDYSEIDSFVIYMCLGGKMEIHYSDVIVEISMGQTVLIPACIKILEIVPLQKTEMLEVYIP